jgi:hypothetical protein
MDSKAKLPDKNFFEAGVNEYGEPNFMTDNNYFQYWFSWKTPSGFRYDCIKSGCEGRLYWYPHKGQKLCSIRHNCRNTPHPMIEVSFTSLGSG